MKLTPANRAILVFMASTPGRYTRIAMGVTVLTLALIQAGWFLLLLPLGGFMIYSGLANVCPLGPLFKQPFKSGELLKSIQKYELK
jgi:hypothetical protein